MLSIKREMKIPVLNQYLYLGHINTKLKGMRLDERVGKKLSSISFLQGEIIILVYQK